MNVLRIYLYIALHALSYYVVMCKIKHWVLVLNPNAALSFAACCISRLSLVFIISVALMAIL